VTDSETLQAHGAAASDALRIRLSAHKLFNEEYYWSGGSETLDPGSTRRVPVTTSVLFK
jgi:hypothetical protein